MNNNLNCPVHAGPYTPIDDFAQIFCQCSGPLETVEQWANAEDLVYPKPQPNLPAPSSPTQTTITVTLPVTTTRNRWQCPICPDSFPHLPERQRHELTHFPYFMHCPLPHCLWRGDRVELFKKHWEREDHRLYHGYYGHTPEESQIETYDPWEVLNKIKSGAIPPREGVDEAILLVKLKAYELQKMKIWADPWGRKRK